ncbi:unnamed protein product [Phytophthora lilii]|uniref:Unnamed protein product n=1 Tax=Phytophthora lilii TaxID=2077276 RepID=A0A9W6TWE3_9STRA|nr:unnamed protein product [Phytophthora lilii]
MEKSEGVEAGRGLEEGHLVGAPKANGRRQRYVCTLLALIPTFAVLLTGLVILDVVLETDIVSHSPASILLNYQGICVPKIVNASAVDYHSNHTYYDELRDMGHVPEPVFRDEHTGLCSEWSRSLKKYGYCLPISGRKDTPFCETPNRLDLLQLRSTKSICYASVLHMLLVEVYEELQATGNTPFLAFGSLLGAVRNNTVIPFTEDVDIGFVGEMQAETVVREALRQKGYHMFFMNIWRVCVAPTHPLAGYLYDPSLPVTEEYTVPYLDLYKMERKGNRGWEVEFWKGNQGRILPDEKVMPFSQVTLNGMQFDTVQDPKYFLKKAYGSDYMTPKPRSE